MTLLLCPLCSQPRFTNLESLKFNLIKVATQNISCPICNEVLVGLDKLTIHLFGHSISSELENSIVNLKACKIDDDAAESGNFLFSMEKYGEREKNFNEGEKSTCGDKESACTINMEDLGFLTSLACLDEINGKTMEAEMKKAKDNPKTDDLELSECMSDLLNKKLLNFDRDSSGGSHSPKTMEVERDKEDQEFKCVSCNSTFQNCFLLALHVDLNHPTHDKIEKDKPEFEKLTADPMDTSGASNGSFIRDLIFPRYDCHLCKKSFKMKGSLLVHYKVAHLGPNYVESSSPLGSQDGSDDKNFRCYICNKAFKKDQLLTQHIKTHEGKQWRCDTCSKCFTTKYFLKKHQRLHTGEMPYSCQTCNKTFTFQQSYRKHLLYHSDEKPHKCAQCGRAFKELSTLHNHQRIHSGEKPFACEMCGKCFRQRVSYIVHQRIHTGVLPYECTACRKKFRYKVSQRSHKCPSQPPGIVVRVPSEFTRSVPMNTSDTLLCLQ